MEQLTPAQMEQDRQKQIAINKAFTPTRNHNHFWIESGWLYESYTTIRGMRYRHLIYLGRHVFYDNNKLEEYQVQLIKKNYLARRTFSEWIHTLTHPF